MFWFIKKKYTAINSSSSTILTDLKASKCESTKKEVGTGNVRDNKEECNLAQKSSEDARKKERVKK